MILLELTTRHFTFHALGDDKAQALEALVRTISAHFADYGRGEEDANTSRDALLNDYRDDIREICLVPGQGARDYEPFPADDAPALIEPINTPIARHGGGDPDKKNAERIAWGQALVECLGELTGVDPEDAVGDAIAYLLHAAPTWGETAQVALRRGVNGFNDDTRRGVHHANV